MSLVSYSTKPVPAELAYRWGLVADELVSSEDEGTSLDRLIAIADSIGAHDLKMVRRYKKALEEGGKMEFGKGLQRERELGIAHYLEAMSDGSTFENAKEFIRDDERPRSKL